MVGLNHVGYRRLQYWTVGANANVFYQKVVKIGHWGTVLEVSDRNVRHFHNFIYILYIYIYYATYHFHVNCPICNVI